jgi:phage baseplate assembly protein W
MPTYIGYSSIHTKLPRNIARNVQDTTALNKSANRSGRSVNKFTLTDERLVVADLINALNIKQGDKVGQPGYGTTIWSYIFEPNTSDVRSEIETELRRIIALDPRINLNNVAVYSYNNGILLEVDLSVNGYNQPLSLQISLDRNTGRATPT